MNARLFPDYAAAPTPRERRLARATNRAGQLDMFGGIDAEHRADGIPSCAACAGDHRTGDCPHGTALTLDVDEHRADEPADRWRPAGPICDRSYSTNARNPYARRNGQCMSCGHWQDEHAEH